MKIKHIFVINGRGSSGKDTLVKSNYWVDSTGSWNLPENISAIDPIKKIAKEYFGYEEDKKDLKTRKFLSDLKDLAIEYNDLPFNYIYNLAKRFTSIGMREIMFVHIREPEEIEKFKKAILELKKYSENTFPDSNDIRINTILITGNDTDDKIYGNKADDNVESYEYDYKFENNLPKEESQKEFVKFITKIVYRVSG